MLWRSTSPYRPSDDARQHARDFALAWRCSPNALVCEARNVDGRAANGASGQWFTAPGALDGEFGPYTKVSVQAFQTWGGVKADGVVGDQTWAVSLHAAGATLETAVGLQFVIG
jgi:peptidoglycan hydrolase-like protein with peptidoglycan-binding domain